MSVVYGHYSRTDYLRDIRARVYAERQYGAEHLVDRHRAEYDVVNNKQLHHHRRAANDRQIDLSYPVQEFQLARLIVRRADNGDDKPENEADSHRAYRDKKRVQKPVRQIAPAVFLNKILRKFLAERDKELFYTNPR